MRWCMSAVKSVSVPHVGLRLLHASMPTQHILLSSEPMSHILPPGAILRCSTEGHRSSSALPTSAVARGYSREEEDGAVRFRKGRRVEGRGCRWLHVGSSSSWRPTTTAAQFKNRQLGSQCSRVVARLSAGGAASGAGTQVGTEPDLAVVAETLSAAMGARVAPPSHPTYDIRTAVKAALAEDFGDKGDLTSLATVPAGTQAEAQFLAKADGVLAGIAVADMVFEQVDPSLKVTWTLQDGDYVTKGTVFGTVTGEARSILAAERVALNFMQRMSGIATATKEMADLAQPARMLETRKTVPGLRLLDKWAVLIGGGENHRMGLYDMLLIKDNHIAAAGGLKQAVAAATQYIRQHGLSVGVEVETRTLEELQEVLQCIRDDDAIVTRVMLDNMTVVKDDGSIDVSMLRDAVAMVGGLVETEASGNVTLETVAAIGATGVTFISSGALTHSVRALDISLNIDTELAVKVGQRTNRA